MNYNYLNLTNFNIYILKKDLYLKYNKRKLIKKKLFIKKKHFRKKRIYFFLKSFLVPVNNLFSFKKDFLSIKELTIKNLKKKDSNYKYIHYYMYFLYLTGLNVFNDSILLEKWKKYKVIKKKNNIFDLDYDPYYNYEEEMIKGDTNKELYFNNCLMSSGLKIKNFINYFNILNLNKHKINQKYILNLFFKNLKYSFFRKKKNIIRKWLSYKFNILLLFNNILFNNNKYKYYSYKYKGKRNKYIDIYKNKKNLWLFSKKINL